MDKKLHKDIFERGSTFHVSIAPLPTLIFSAMKRRITKHQIEKELRKFGVLTLGRKSFYHVHQEHQDKVIGDYLESTANERVFVEQCADLFNPGTSLVFDNIHCEL